MKSKGRCHRAPSSSPDGFSASGFRISFGQFFLERIFPGSRKLSFGADSAYSAPQRIRVAMMIRNTAKMRFRVTTGVL